MKISRFGVRGTGWCSIATLLALPLLLNGCSSRATPTADTVEFAQQQQQQIVYLQSGSLTLTRQFPQRSVESSSSDSLLAFSPLPTVGDGTWLVIDRRTRTVSLMRGEETLQSAHGEGVENLAAGRFTVEHKQRSPLWYAPAEYFTRRNLPVPPEGGKERYLRGALGEFSIFLNKDTPLHDGPVWSSELGGIRMQESDISRLYYQVEVGTPVEIK